MKAIMMSIKPQWVEKILNKEKTIEVRKKFPKNYVGWVYIYVTKDRNKTLSYQVIPHDKIHVKGYDGFNDKDFDFQFMPLTKTDINNGWGWFAKNNNLNGKVVARFWCDNVEKFDRIMIDFEREYLKQNACISQLELDNYIKDNIGYAIHITKLEIFDEPKEISEFYNRLAPNFERLVKYYEKRGEKYTRDDYDRYCEKVGYKLTRAPQSFMFIEV